MMSPAHRRRHARTCMIALIDYDTQPLIEVCGRVEYASEVLYALDPAPISGSGVRT